MERAWREPCWPSPSCSSLLRQICEWRQRLGGHCSPSRELVKKNRRSQPTALLRPQIYMTPVGLSDISSCSNHPSRGSRILWSKNNPSLLCPARTSDPQNCEHSMWLSFQSSKHPNTWSPPSGVSPGRLCPSAQVSPRQPLHRTTFALQPMGGSTPRHHALDYLLSLAFKNLVHLSK